MDLQIYLKPIMSALYIFPFLAAIFTLPYVVLQYRKYGAILILRVVIVYTFIFYMMTSYFMTILPLPPIDSVTPDTASVLLTPFEGIQHWRDTSGINFHDPSTYLHSLKNSYFLQMFFNVLLLFPFGVYLRYYFRRPWYQVILLSFLYSLFFELTQLSGLYGIYPYPYRYFEVDDLICNTLGGFLGFIFTPMFSFILPSRKRLDEMSYERGSRISLIRRFLALAIDMSVVLAGLFIMTRYSESFNALTQEAPFHIILLPVAAFLYFSVFMILFRGRTPGKSLVKLRIVDENGRAPAFYKVIIRNAILYLFIMPGILHITSLLELLDSDSNDTRQFILIIIVSLYIALMAYSALNILICFVKRDSQFRYDKICHLRTISTIEKDLRKSTENSAKKQSTKKHLSNKQQSEKKSSERHSSAKRQSSKHTDKDEEFNRTYDDLYDDEPAYDSSDTMNEEEEAANDNNDNDDIDIYY